LNVSPKSNFAIYPVDIHHGKQGSTSSISSGILILIFCLPLITAEEMLSTDSEKLGIKAFQDEAPVNHPMATEIPWWKQPLLRQLYFMMTFLFLGSTTLGYDGSVLNGLQTMTSWQECTTHSP
jgi:hypothetical protein